MSESKCAMPITAKPPAGSLKNRIDNNLKLSIPKQCADISNVKNHPSTAPCGAARKSQFGDFANLMKNWNQNDPDEGFIATTPSSIIGTPSLKREIHHQLLLRNSLIDLYFQNIHL